MNISQLFNRDGYVIFPENTIFKKRNFRTLCDKYIKIFKREIPHIFPLYNCWGIGSIDQIQKIDQTHLYDTDILDIVANPKLGELIAKVTSCNRISICASHVFYKPPYSGDSGNVGWHTDTKYVNFENGELISVWIPLSFIEEQSGTLTFLKASHVWSENINCIANNGAEKDIRKQKLILQSQAPKNYEWKEEKVMVEPGGMSFHHNNVWHYSSENNTPFPRISISIALFVEKGVDLDDKVVINNTIYPIFQKNNKPIVIYEAKKSQTEV